MNRERKVVFVVKGRFSYERNILSYYYRTKQLQMCFCTLGITYLKILISKIIVFQMSRNRYFAQKEGLCVKAVTEPDSAESTEITDPVRTEPTEYNAKIRYPILGFSFDN